MSKKHAVQLDHVGFRKVSVSRLALAVDERPASDCHYNLQWYLLSQYVTKVFNSVMTFARLDITSGH